MSFCPGDFTLALISSPFLPGLEYSAGEGTNYPPKFDSAPGKPVFKSLLFSNAFSILFEPLVAKHCSIERSLFLTGAWRSATEEWGTEDWNEDVSVSGLNLLHMFQILGALGTSKE